jgi:hypothetical protein
MKKGGRRMTRRGFNFPEDAKPLEEACAKAEEQGLASFKFHQITKTGTHPLTCNTQHTRYLLDYYRLHGFPGH